MFSLRLSIYTIRFHHRFWIDASSENKLRQDYGRAADSIGLPDDKRSPEDVISWLESQTKRWLLVLDDVSAGVPKLQEFLPAGGPGFILCSSQRSITWMDVKAPVEGLSPEAASELLLRMSEKRIDRSDKAVEELTSELKYLPLAICVAGAFIRHRDYTIAQYLQKWRNYIFNDFDDPDDASPNQRSLDATFRMTIEDMRIHNQVDARVASDLLKLVAFLDHKHVSEQILHDAWQYRYNQYRQPRFIGPRDPWIEVLETGNHKDWDKVRPDIQKALKFLEKYSLLSVDREEGFKWQVLSVHSLIHAWIRKSMEMPERKSWYTKTATILAANFSKDQPMSNDIVSHLDRMRETRADERFAISELRCSFSDDNDFVPSGFADIYARQGYFVEAKNLRFTMCLKLKPSDDPRVQIDCISLLAESCADLGEHHKASFYYNQALDIALNPAFYGKDPHCKMQALRCVMEVARNARKLEDHEQAFELSHQAWERLNSLHKANPNHRELLSRYLQSSREMAVNKLALGRADEAVNMLKDVVQTHQRIAKCDDHDLLQSRSDLADALSQVGRHEDAFTERKEVLRQRNANIMDRLHTDRLIAQECVALSLVAMGKFSEAYDLRMAVLDEWDLCKRQIPVDYPPLLLAKMNLAHNLEVLRHWKKAEEVYDEVFECKRQLAVPHHRRHCHVQQCLNPNEALLCVETHRAFGTDEAIEALEGKALSQFRRQDMSSAAQTYKLIKGIWKPKLHAAPYQRRKYLASLNRLGELARNCDDRIAHRRQILALQEQGGKRTDTDTMTTRLYLGLDYYTTRQYIEACRHLETVLKEGKTLKTMLPKEFEEAEKACKNAREALLARNPPASPASAQRPRVSTPQSPQQGNQPQARHQQGIRGRGSPPTGSGGRGGSNQGPRGGPGPRMHPPFRDPLDELFQLFGGFQPFSFPQHRPRGQ